MALGESAGTSDGYDSFLRERRRMWLCTPYPIDNAQRRGEHRGRFASRFGPLWVALDHRTGIHAATGIVGVRASWSLLSWTIDLCQRALFIARPPAA